MLYIEGVIFDISVPVSNRIPVWPGDLPVALEEQSFASADRSHTIRLTSITCGNHTGTHLDAPSHMIEGGASLDDIPLGQLVGPARVVDLAGSRSIGLDDVAGLDWDGVERVLFRTDNSSHWDDGEFFADFVALEPDAARFLVDRGIRLVGIDYLSIDSFHAPEHPSHMVLLGASVVVLEGLILKDVPAGDYLLAALPMKLDRADGAPARAILISTDQPSLL
jgi:arylformamidase